MKLKIVMDKITSEIKKSTKILIIDDESAIREVLAESLKDEGFLVETASDGESGLAKIRDFSPQLVFLDIWMPGTLDGMEVLARGRAKFPEIDFIMISGHGNIETAVRATKTGAWDFIEKPLSMDKIFITAYNAIQYRIEREEKSLLLNKLRKSIALVGETNEFMEVKKLIAKVAPADSWQLIQGETGSGKQLVAENIHYMSSRAGHPYTVINCMQTPEDLLEGEIFGFEKSSMPGMDRTRKGKLELAQGGTLVLTEISAMNLQCQSKLMRYHKEGQFQRVGSSELLSADVRIMVCSAVDLQDLVASKQFLEELYFAISSVPIRIPALKNRRPDLPALTYYFSDLIAKEGGYAVKVFSERALDALSEHHWPGNVRELRNFIERAYILTPTELIDLHDVRFAGLFESRKSGDAETAGLGEFENSPNDSTFREARARFEKDYLLKKIQENGGNISRTAEIIGLERSYLHRKIKTYGIDV